MSALTLRGIVPPVITPLWDTRTLDRDGFRRVLDRQIDGGVCAIFVLGTTGEAPSLNYKLRREVVECAADVIAGRVPMLVGVTDTSFDESVALANVARDCGAAAAVVAPPYYFAPSGDDLKQYYREIAQALPIPTVLYHMPELTKVRFSLDFLEFALDVPEIVALKDSSGDLDFFWRACHLAKKRDSFPILVGPEHQLEPATRLGGSGGVNGGANIWPQLFVDMFAAANANDTAKIADLQRKIDRLDEIYAVASGGMGVARGIKYACHYLGLCSDLPAEPFHPLKPEEKAKIEQIVDELQGWGCAV